MYILANFRLINDVQSRIHNVMKDAVKKTMTLNLTKREMDALEALAAEKDLTKTGVMKLALRLLQTVDDKVRMGQKLLFEDEDSKEKSELLLI